MVAPLVGALAPVIWWAGVKVTSKVGGAIQRAVSDGLEYDHEMQPDYQMKFYRYYAASIGLQGGAASGAFDKYAEDRIKGVNGFTTVKAPDGTSLADKLQGSPAVLKSLNDGFALSPNGKKAQVDFNEDLATVDKMLVDPQSRCTAGDVVAFMHFSKDRAIKAINAQHGAELAHLKKEFNPPKFDNAALNTALGANTPEEAAKVYNQMKTALEGNHSKQMQEFEKSLNASITKLHESAQQDRDRVMWFATKYHQNEEYRKQIDMLIQKRDAKSQDDVSIGFGADPYAKFKGLDPKDLAFVQSMYGRNITKGEDGTYHMQLPRRWTSPFYYSDWKTEMKSDMMELFQAVKACGYKKINVNISHTDPDHAIYLAKAAYAAARESGIPAENLTINVNGKKMSGSEIFKDDPASLQSIDGKAKLNDQKRADVENKISNRYTQADFKNQVQKYREKEQLKQAPPQPDPGHIGGHTI